MKLIDKLMERILTKIEFKISKKEKKIATKNNVSERLKLYRDLLNRIDEYRSELDNSVITRHYRYFRFTVDKESENK